jgi:hypothetical protein
MSRLVARAVVSSIVSVVALVVGSIVLWLGPALVLTAGAPVAAAPVAAAPVAAAAPARPLWSRQVEKKKSHVGTLQVADGVLLAGTESGHIVGIDPRTGRTLWKQRHPEPAGWDLRMAVSGGRVIAAMSDHATLVAYEPRTGKVAWKRELAPIGTLEACPGHRLVAVSHPGRGPDGAVVDMVHALDPATGQTLWQTPADGVLVGSGDGWLIAVRPGEIRKPRRHVAVRCSDGAVRELPPAKRETQSLLHAAEGKVVIRHAEMGGPTSDLVCVTEVDFESPPGSGAEHCFEGTDGTSEWVKVMGARLQDGVVHVVLWRSYSEDPKAGPTWWVFRYDLASRRMVGRSEPETSIGEMVGGAGLIVTGFGDHDGPHFGRVVEAATGQWLASVGLRTLPSAVALDGERAYFATMGGEVVAVALPRPGPAPVAEVPVTPRPETGTVAPNAKGPSLGWRLVRTFDAHPRTARSAGAVADGLAEAVAFLDEQRLAVGGNDDWVAVFDAVQGKQLWRSKKLGDDVQSVAVCERGFAAMAFGGDVTLFEAGRSGRSFVAGKPIVHDDMAWMLGATPGCVIVAETFDEELRVYAGGRERVVFSLPGRIDPRLHRMVGAQLAVVGPHLVVPQPGKLEVYDVAAAAASGATGQPVAVYETHAWAHDGKLSQTWLLGDGRLLREYCGEKRCVVELVPQDRSAPRTLSFAIRGDVMNTGEASMIAAARDGGTLVFFRRGLDAVIVDTATDRRQSLADLAGLPRDVVTVSFAPSGKRMAVAGYPLPWQVSILERP